MGDVIVTLDADLQNDPDDIPRLVEHLLYGGDIGAELADGRARGSGTVRDDGGYDMVCGWRRERQDDVIRRVPSQVANWLIGRVTGVSRMLGRARNEETMKQKQALIRLDRPCNCQREMDVHWSARKSCVGCWSGRSPVFSSMCRPPTFCSTKNSCTANQVTGGESLLLITAPIRN